MIRRLPATIAAVVLAGVFASGCSTFSKNNNAASVGGHTLSIEDFGVLTTDLGAPLTAGDIAGTDARSVIQEWVRATALLDAFDLDDQAARDEVEQEFTASNAEKWNTLAPVTKKYYIDYSLTQRYLIDHPELAGAEQLQALYERGVGASGAICLRAIVATTEDQANALIAELADGKDFATLADENPIDGAGATNGGVIVADASTGSECFAASDSTPAEIVQALVTTPIGEPTPAVSVNDGYIIMLQRPYAEVADDAASFLSTAVSSEVTISVLADAAVEVDSRYGMWDTATATVVQTR